MMLIGEAMNHAGEDTKDVELMERLERRRITPDTELPPIDFLFRMFNKPCFPRGELIAVTGRPKSGKTFVTSMLMALCQNDEVLGIKRESPVPLSVLWYDTEQSDLSTQDILKNRILPMIGEESDTPFHVFNVRQEMWRERMPLLEVAIKHLKPDFVILDGIRDLVNDINDGELAQEVVEGLMHLASEFHCCIVCVLHQNKSAEDSNLRGWIGTELTHKAFEVYECQKDPNTRIFSLKQKMTRKYDIMDELRYVVDEHGIPQVACVEQILAAENAKNAAGSRPKLYDLYVIEWKGNTPVYDLERLYADAIPECGVKVSARELQAKVMNLTNITSIFFYNKVREQALAENIIIKSSNHNNHIFYYRPEKTNGNTLPPSTPTGQPLLFYPDDDAPF